jgi:hypothetical protein
VIDSSACAKGDRAATPLLSASALLPVIGIVFSTGAGASDLVFEAFLLAGAAVLAIMLGK